MSEDIYLFIDGEYLRSKYASAMQRMFLCDGDISFERIKSEARAKRVYFYDCVDDEQHTGESNDEFVKRAAAQEDSFNKIGDWPRHSLAS